MQQDNTNNTNNVPLLPEEELRAYVKKYFRAAEGIMGSVGAHRLPVYVLETATLSERAGEFRKAFFDVLPDVDFYYAVKSNNHPVVAEALLKYGFGLDVSSGRELRMALDLGARKAVFSGPGKTREELRAAVLHSERVIILIDSFGELSRLQEIAEDEGRDVRAGVRLSTGSEWGKFGIAPAELRSFCRKAEECPRIRLSGIQFHTSWNLSPDAQCGFIERLAAVLAGLPADLREQMAFLDIGGGYWPPAGEWLHHVGRAGEKPLRHYAHVRLPSTPIEEFAGTAARAILTHILPLMHCAVYFEPGRWICNDAMHLLLTVIDRKSERLVITDAGTNAVGWERFETDYCPVLNLSRPSLVERPCNIMGSLCTPRDVWGYSYFGEDIREGDVLMIPCQGAYTYSLRQDFIKPLPDVIVL